MKISNIYAAPADGIYFESLECVIKGCVVKSGVYVFTSSSYSPTTLQWLRCVIQVTTSMLIIFTIYADDSDTILWTETLNIAAPTAAVKHGLMAVSSGIVVVTLLTVDYMDLYSKGRKTL